MIEDHEPSRELLREILESCGARGTSADSAKDGLLLFTQENADIIISDISMPDRDGLEFIRSIRSMRNGVAVPALALTALARENDCMNSLAAGFNAHLSKPVKPEALLEHVDKLLT